MSFYKPTRRTKWTKADRDRMSEAQNHRCCYCGVKMDDANKYTRPTTEHIYPRNYFKSQAAWDSETNVVVACQQCNSKKDNMPPTLYNPSNIAGRYSFYANTAKMRQGSDLRCG